MASLFSSGKYSDLTITCGNRAFHVHRAFLCSASRFFDAACDGVFKEAHESHIDFSDDDPNTLERLLRFLYTTDYDDNNTNDNNTAEETNGKGTVANASSTSSAQIDNAISQVTSDASESEREDESVHHKVSAIMNNVAVYALADKYNIASLKDLAKEKFENRCACFRWETESLVATLEFVYTSTPPADQGLRNVMARVCFQQIHVSSGMVLDAPQLQELMVKEGALGLNILVKAHEDARSLMVHSKMLIEKLKKLEAERDKEASDLVKERAKVLSLETQLASATDGTIQEMKDLHSLVWKTVLCSCCNKILDLKVDKTLPDGQCASMVSLSCRSCTGRQMTLRKRPK
ncbi:MAG: hypothetical protein LQ341_007033 [Variospora aurantia]|nr:MAG: hypothetical protein LQ341_007033 [Variospora aurantia]